MTHCQRAAMVKVYRADQRGETCRVRQGTAEALVTMGYVEALPVSGHCRLTAEGDRYMRL